MNKHGGYFGDKINKVIDFSVNVNPLGVPPKLIDSLSRNLDNIIKYPEIDGDTSKVTLSNYLNINKEELILGNGATEIIYLFARAIKPKKVLIIEPTFTEYRRAFDLVGSEIYDFISQEKDKFQININYLTDEIKRIKPDVVVICNPNNPTGIFTNKDKIKPVLEEISNTGAILFTDESFIDFVDKDSYIDLINDYPLFILRSMTKFFAIPGLRLGYGIANSEIIASLNNIKEPWTLNSLALSAIPVLLEDKEYQNNVLEWYKSEKSFLFKGLNEIEYLDVLDSEANYFLCQLKGISLKEIKEKMLEKGFYIRTCEDFKGLRDRYIRIALRSREDNQRLLQAFNQIKI